MGLMVPMITRGALGRNDLLNNYGTTNFVQPPINDLTSLMMRGSMGGGMMGGLGGAMMGGMADPVGGIMGAAANPVGAVMGGMGSPVGGMGGSMINQSSVGGFVAGAAVGAVAMNAMQNGGLNGANSIDHPNRGNQPQNSYNNGGGYNNQPQRNSDPLGDIFNQPSQPQRNVQPNPSQMGQNALEPVRNSPNSGNTNFGVQHPVSTAPAAYASNPRQAQPVVRRNRVEPTGDRLAKGQKYSIKDRDGRPATQLKICLGWDIKDGRCELDASAFMLADNGKVVGDEWFIFYGQPDSPDNGVHYKVYKDDPNSPDDAAIVLDLTRVDQRVQKIALAVTIYEASQHALNFGMVQNLYARILDSRTNREIACFRMDECYSSVTAMVLGELYRYKGEWKFNAVGSGVNQDLAQFCGMYGVALE